MLCKFQGVIASNEIMSEIFGHASYLIHVLKEKVYLDEREKLALVLKAA